MSRGSGKASGSSGGGVRDTATYHAACSFTNYTAFAFTDLNVFDMSCVRLLVIVRD